MKHTMFLTVGVVVAIILGVAGLFGGGTNTIETVREMATGAVVGPDTTFPCESKNGIKTCYESIGFMATSSILCAARPADRATSTIRSITVNAVAFGGLGTGQTVSISTTSSSVAYGSSTPAFVQQRTLALQDPIVWPAATASTSPAFDSAQVLANGLANGSSNAILAPGEWVTVRVATATPRTLASYATGKCNFVFDMVN